MQIYGSWFYGSAIQSSQFKLSERCVSISACSSPWPSHLQHRLSSPPIAPAIHISLIFQEGESLILLQLLASSLCLTGSDGTEITQRNSDKII